MSLAIKYESVEDAKMRLRQTVVLYKGNPVMITDVIRGDGDDIFRVLFREIPIDNKEVPFPKRRGPGVRGDMAAKVDDDLEKRKYISSKHFDIAPFRLGYVNHPKGAFFCTRMPNRVQKQGLCVENFSAKKNNGEQVPFNVFTTCKETVEMVLNQYPSFERALALLDKSPSVAFHRDFAITRDEVVPKLLYLYHKGTKVGMWSHNEVTLGKKYDCLKESLQEMKLKVGVC